MFKKIKYRYNKEYFGANIIFENDSVKQKFQNSRPTDKKEVRIKNDLFCDILTVRVDNNSKNYLIFFIWDNPNEKLVELYSSKAKNIKDLDLMFEYAMEMFNEI